MDARFGEFMISTISVVDGCVIPRVHDLRNLGSRWMRNFRGDGLCARTASREIVWIFVFPGRVCSIGWFRWRSRCHCSHACCLDRRTLRSFIVRVGYTDVGRFGGGGGVREGRRRCGSGDILLRSPLSSRLIKKERKRKNITGTAASIQRCPGLFISVDRDGSLYLSKKNVGPRG